MRYFDSDSLTNAVSRDRFSCWIACAPLRARPPTQSVRIARVSRTGPVRWSRKDTDGHSHGIWDGISPKQPWSEVHASAHCPAYSTNLTELLSPTLGVAGMPSVEPLCQGCPGAVTVTHGRYPITNQPTVQNHPATR